VKETAAMTATKLASELKPGDVVDLTQLGVNPPIRTVRHVTWHPTGIPEAAVIVEWEEAEWTNTLRHDKELTIR
jgi:hypothetical protein